MEIILSRTCKSLTGSLGRSLGYYIRSARSKDGTVRFYGQRSKHSVPPNGHWRFIIACAELAQMSLHIADVKITRKEIADALWEAEKKVESGLVLINAENYPNILDAKDVLQLKKNLSL